MKHDVIEIQGLQKSYGPTQILKNLNWNIQAGQAIGLLARNGAGKSTLFETILGLQDADGGQVRIFGEDIKKMSDATRAKIGFVPQNPDLYGWLSPRMMLQYFENFYPRWNRNRVESLLHRWDLHDIGERLICTLSPGQKQRLSIIRAVAHDPELLILDEPAASLDPGARREFLREIVDILTQQETTLLYSTHILSDLERVAMDCAFMAHGKIQLQAPLDALHEQVFHVNLSQSEAQALQGIGVRLLKQSQITSTGMRALLWFEHGQMQSARSKFPHLHLENITLEDFFIEVTA
ncbi:ABC transporter ATP-binding protein [Massilia sp. W12]|uniref:ABC transporter ATP-binding protein n=1 Tax=Massilia sp. W12 TaxID=3126507 RepID=UPI0030CF2CA6